MDEHVTIDGSQGEGGGQMLRTSLALGAAYGKPFEMVNIRAKREKPGLKRQHLTCVRAVAQICDAQVEGDEVGSMRLSFMPGKIKGGTYRFDIGTAGSVTLVAQTVIPVLLRADEPSMVTITGGTHVPFAPIWEFFAETYLPELRKMGAHVEAELVRHGFYPAAGGEVKLRIEPMGKVREYRLAQLGPFRGGKVVGIVANLDKGIAETEVNLVSGRLSELELVPELRSVESSGPGNCCYVRLDYANVTVVLSDIGTYNRSRRTVANTVASRAKAFLKSGAAVEKHLADQLLLPLCLFLGDEEDVFFNRPYVPWCLANEEETEHFLTNEMVIDAFKRP